MIRWIIIAKRGRAMVPLDAFDGGLDVRCKAARNRMTVKHKADGQANQCNDGGSSEATTARIVLDGGMVHPMDADAVVINFWKRIFLSLFLLLLNLPGPRDFLDA